MSEDGQDLKDWREYARMVLSHTDEALPLRLVSDLLQACNRVEKLEDQLHEFTAALPGMEARINAAVDDMSSKWRLRVAEVEHAIRVKDQRIRELQATVTSLNQSACDKTDQGEKS